MALASEAVASRETLRASVLRDWSLVERNAIDADRFFWTPGRLLAAGTVVQPSGGQTITEEEGELIVVPTSAIAVEDMACVLWPRTITVGQKWRATIRLQRSSQFYLMGAVLLTDGTDPTANVVAAMGYINQGVNQVCCAARHGTLTSLATSASESCGVQFLDQSVRHEMTYEVEYSAADTYAFRWYGYGRFGSTATVLFSAVGVAKALTPTHVGIGWTTWGAGATGDPLLTAGPLYRAA